ncbi:hypothetical protein PG993_009013 [Apiospora rasikravindrae]|uniref:Cytochrome P450 n=1 Tax=Apiospora rasikravindrae TaxID=990691 RepID=A0ABR1SI55_9PEZI
MPWWIANYNGNQVTWMCALHDKYGPVVRYGPNDLSYSTGDAWKAILGYERGRDENPKDNIPPINGVRHLITASQEDHARVRRIFSPAFSDRSLKQQEPLFRKYTDQLVRHLEKMAGQQTNLVDLFNFTTFDTIGDLTFGQPLGLLDNNEHTPWVASSFRAIKVVGIFQFIGYYRVISTIFRWLEPQFITNLKLNHFNHTKDRNLCAPQKGKEVLSLKEMHADAELLMSAGSETTASVLSGLFYLLLTHPAVLEAARDEICAAFASESDLSMEGLMNLKYLNACQQKQGTQNRANSIHLSTQKEGIIPKYPLNSINNIRNRHTRSTAHIPPTPHGNPRVAPKGGNMVLGKWVPEGTTLLVHHTSVSQSPAAWRETGDWLDQKCWIV